MKRTLGLFGLLAAATLAGCTLDTGPANNPTNPATETFASSLGVNIASMTKTQSGDYYKDVTVGTGPQLTGNAQIGFDYTGYIKDGTIFDTGSIPVTAGETLANLIVGLQDAMQGMKVGGERLIVVPSDLGYSTTKFTTGRGVTVGPNATLIFDIKLTGITAVP